MDLGSEVSVNVGGNMNERMNILDIELDKMTAKEAMRHFVEYIDPEPAEVMEFVTAESLMQMDEVSGIKKEVCGFELVLPADTTLLKTAGISDKKILKDTENSVLIKMMFRYLHKNHKRIYLLVDTQEDGRKVYEYFEKHYPGIQIGGIAKVVQEDRADDMIVNAINGADIDCVVSYMSSPLQEDFISKTRNQLNIRIWLGLGKEVPVLKHLRTKQVVLSRFIMKKILQKEVEKRKKSREYTRLSQK